MRENEYLDTMFYPRNIAVVGASPKGNMGNNFIMGSVLQNFKGKIFPVNPSGENIYGFTTYKSVRDIPDELDLVIFAVPNVAAMKVMEDCAFKKVRFTHLFTAGFSETGILEFAELEKKILAFAKENGIRILGPNCMGLYCPEGGLAFQTEFPTEAGSVSFFSQSGQLAGFFTRMGKLAGLQFAKVISFGNAIDISGSELLAYLRTDDKTTVIGSYIEGLKDGAKFIEEAKRVTTHKPLVIYKGGQTEGGARATKSHTASIAGSREIWDAVCRQVGIISVESLQEMACTISALQRTGLPSGKRVAIVGGAGGGSVTMTDVAEKAGLTVPQLSEESVRRLKEVIPAAGRSVMNPMDVGMPNMTDDVFEVLFSVLKEDPQIDGLIFIQSIDNLKNREGNALKKTLDRTLRMNKELGKPVFPATEIMDPSEVANEAKEFNNIYHENNIATFPSVQMAAKVMKSLYDYKQYLNYVELCGQYT